MKSRAIPAFQFALNTTFNSAIGCTPFEAGHGLAATTIAQARMQATRVPITAEGGRDGDALEDVDQYFDQSIVKDQMELAVRMAEVARATSEWHRRMTAENLSQSGYVVDLTKYPIGRQAFIYKPPTQAETIARGRKAKHIDHYIGPGTIISHLGTRSMVIQMNGREYQRDAGMVLLEKPKADDQDPAVRDRRIIEVQKYTIGSQEINPLQEGEFVIIKDDPQARDWYCAEVRKILADRIEVNYYTSTTPPLENYEETNNAMKRKRLREATFRRTWCLEKGKGFVDPKLIDHTMQ